MKKILYLLHHYPQLSETYIKTEIDAIRFDYDIRIVAHEVASDPYMNHLPFKVLPRDLDRLAEFVTAFKPDIIHSHWLMSIAGSLSERTGVPFTVRSHSFDTNWNGPTPLQLANDVRHYNSDRCLGVLAFGFSHDLLKHAGIREDKLVVSYPVADLQRFNNLAPNGEGVMGLGACVAKKQMEDILRVAKSGHVKREFNLWAIEYGVDDLKAVNEKNGNPVKFQPGTPHEMMPAVYKKHHWLFVTANREMNTLGWPLCVAEAQASGRGVLLPDLRPDLHEYAGASAYFYNTLDEAAAILASPFPPEKRLAAFHHCQQWDFRYHKHHLTDLWDKASS